MVTATLLRWSLSLVSAASFDSHTVLEGSNTKAFNAVLSKANSYLKRVFGMELIPLIPRDVEAEEEAAATAASQRQKKKKKKRNGDEESSSVDEAAATAAAAAAGKKRKPAARAFALRSTLPADVIAKAIVPMPERIANDPAHTARFAEDAHSELGSAGIARDELKEWKLGRDEIFDWRTGPEQRALMGLLNVILSLIMVNERVLTDEQLMNHLKRLDLRLSTPLPLNPNALNPDKQTLNTFLAQLIKQQYLEKTKVAAAVSGGANAAAAAGAAKNTQGTQRAKATQNTRAGAEAAAEEGAGGSADEEWRWGPRAYVEIGEKGIASFIKDFYGTLASAAEPGANGRPAKDARILEKEILKGTTGGKSKTLQDAREEGADAEE